MRAILVQRAKLRYPDGTIAEIVIWKLPRPASGSPHFFKYRMFFGTPGQRLVGYDNERGKGDHRHYGQVEEAYRFIDVEQLQSDFWTDVDRARSERSHADD